MVYVPVRVWVPDHVVCSALRGVRVVLAELNTGCRGNRCEMEHQRKKKQEHQAKGEIFPLPHLLHTPKHHAVPLQRSPAL